MDHEKWLPIPDYEGFYEVSDQGRVRSLRRRIPHQRNGSRIIPERIMRARLSNGIHPRVKLCRDNKPYHVHVHRLVLETFRGPCPEGHEACHRNDIGIDNRLENLYWGTKVDNMRDKLNNGHNFNANKTHCPQGHEYIPKNTIIKKPSSTSTGGRDCRTCHNERCLKRYWAKRAM